LNKNTTVPFKLNQGFLTEWNHERKSRRKSEREIEGNGEVSKLAGERASRKKEV